jgi:ribose transport system substrate-binding protein
MRRKSRALTGGLVLAVLALLLTACSGLTSSGASTAGGGSAQSAAGTVSVKVGTGTPIKLPKGKLRVAILMGYLTDAWTQNFSASAKPALLAAGDIPTIYDAGASITTQIQQVQTIATNHSADVVIFHPLDGTAECDSATKVLPAANILVVDVTGILCGRVANSGDAMWSPGTLTFDGGDSTVAYLGAFARNTQKFNPGPQNVLDIMGPQLTPYAKANVAAVEAVQQQNPEFHLAGILYTDYTTPDGYAKTIQYLKAHRNITTIMSAYSPDLTRGIINALQASGYKPGQIKITDLGGCQYAFQMLQQGWIEFTQPYTPKTTGAQAAKAIQDAQAGVQVPRITSEVPTNEGTYTEPVTITKQNMSQFTPQY